MTAAGSPTTNVLTLSERLAMVRSRIERACARIGRNPGDVTLIGASKTFPAESILAAFQEGLRDFGENRVQEGSAKAAELAAKGIEPTWHMVGHLQTNKVRAALGAFAILHAVDSERLLEAVSAAAAAPVPVFIEVNVAGEATKFGVAPAELTGLLRRARELPHVAVEGLMTVPPLVGDPEDARPVFRALWELADEHGLAGLSMGMSDDFEVAIEEGATHIRVGRAIFGERA
jgi:PLP dependent protein